MEHIGTITQVEYNSNQNTSQLILENNTKYPTKFTGNYEKWTGHPLLKKGNGQLKIGEKEGHTQQQKNQDHQKQKPIGHIYGKTTTNQVTAKIKPEKEKSINELDLVKIEHNEDIALGQVTEYIRTKDRKAAVTITIIGIPKAGRIHKVKVPFKQNSRIYPARFQELKEAMNLHPNGLYIGHIHNSNIPVKIDLKAFMQSHTAIFSKNRYGKTYALRVLTEELINHGKPILVFDARDEYIFNKENQNPKEKKLMKKYGIQPTSYATKHIRYTFSEPQRPRDVKIRLDQLEKPKLYTDHLIKPGQASIISMPSADGYEEEKRIIATTLEMILQLGKKNQVKPCFIIIEEGERYVPQTQGKSRHLQAIQNIAMQGAQKGLNLGIVGHRMAKVDKDALSQCQNYMILQTTMDNDVTKIKKSVEGAKQYEKVIKGLPKGTAYITGMTERPLLVDIRPSKTHHYGAQVDVAEIYEQQPTPDIENLRKQIQKV